MPRGKAAETVSNFTRTAAETNKALFGDITRMFADMRFPTMLPDAGVLMAAHRRNMDVLSQANRLALEGAQAVARRHMEIMQQTMHELTEHVRELASSDTPQHKAARQAELVKQSYERAVTNIRELSDLIQRSNGEAVELLNARFKEAMDEIKGLLEKPGEKAGLVRAWLRRRFGLAPAPAWFRLGCRGHECTAPARLTRNRHLVVEAPVLRSMPNLWCFHHFIAAQRSKGLLPQSAVLSTSLLGPVRQIRLRSELERSSAIKRPSNHLNRPTF